MKSVIAAIATPNAAGGIGVIRISGEGSIAVADKVFFAVSEKPLSSLKGYRAAYGRISDTSGNAVDDAVALVFRAPKSYTGEDVVELSCHGGMLVMQKVLRLVLAAGASPAKPGEFTKRAYLNGRIGLAEAEAVMGLISAHGEQGLNASRTALDGALSKKIRAVSAELISLAASLAVWADYPDEDIPCVESGALREALIHARGTLSALIEKFDAGQALTAGVETVICGRPNAGKSTLMNLLTRRESSIVTPVEGTTRDIIEETVTLGSIALRLADTAGLRVTQDMVENIGVERAWAKMERAGLILAVFDCSRRLDDEDIELLNFCKGRRAVAVVNKIDLEMRADAEIINKYIHHTVELSAASGQGETELEHTIAELLGTDEIDTGAAMLTTERQYRCCCNALESIDEAIGALQNSMTLDAVNVSIDYAVDGLLELTGQRAGEAVVNEVFSRFCVGK